jgi:hypothetical protein
LVKLWKQGATGPSEIDQLKKEPAFKSMQGRKDFQDLLRDGGSGS